jgi:hypothetical protein
MRKQLDLHNLQHRLRTDQRKVHLGLKQLNSLDNSRFDHRLHRVIGHHLRNQAQQKKRQE